ELFENLPEIGDPEKPTLVFFFDEAHLLFADIAPAVEQKIEQVVRLIRSKGVGVYFVSQNPLDIPDVVLGQLGNRVQHALRAFTPRDQKAVKAAAETFRQNPKLKVEAVLTQLAVGEALVSMLDENGSPQIVERAKIVPPRSQVGAITPDQRKQIVNSSVLAGHYEKAIDRESAYEILQARAGEKVQTAGAPPVAAAAAGDSCPLATALWAVSEGRTATWLQKKSPGAKDPAILFAFDYFFFGSPAGLAPSFFPPPLPAFTSTSVADIV